MTLLAGLAASTLLSEDAACLTAAWLIQQGTIGPVEGVAACAAGIYGGDALLWLAGRLSTRWRVSGAGPLAPALRRAAAATAAHVDSPFAILASRFLPGTRLPLYLAAGAVGRRPRAFFLWTLVAVLLWTPLVVLGASRSLLAAALAIVVLHIARPGQRRHWGRFRARVERWRRWEFWPSAVLYLPVALHVARLAIKHGGLGTLTAANPAIPDGGFVGESKASILAQLPEEWTLRAHLIPDGGDEARLEDLRQLVELGEHSFPLILKPDAGQRGAGVRLVRSLDEARAYLSEQPGAIVAQEFHEGPFEAGIFYYRRPGELRGRIFSVTDKRFPIVTGDGLSTLEELIWSHPRYRLQGDLFVRRHASDLHRVLAGGERLRLAIAGNHCQGTTFLDGAGLLTPSLEARVDAIARQMPGFYIGRFDVRYRDREAFRRGEDLAIVELNGVTSESTNIYDPSFTLIDAWRVLCRQWTLVFEIGAANRRRGMSSTPAARLLRLSWRHVRTSPAVPVSS